MPLDAAQWQIDILAADKTAQAFSAVDRRLRSLDASQKSLSSSSNTMAGAVAGKLVGMAAAYITLEKAAQLAEAAVSRVWEAGVKAGDLGEQAEQIGVTTDQLQAYRLTAAQAGVSSDQLDQALMRLQGSMGQAVAGNDEMIARFDKLGVKLLDAKGNLRPVADVLPELARGLLDVSSESQRNAMMLELMGRSGSRMATILRDVAAGSDALVASAKAQSAVVGGETAEAWDALGDKLKVSNQRMDAMLATLAKPIATIGVDLLKNKIDDITHGLGVLKSTWQSVVALFGGGSLENQLDKANADIVAFIQRGYTESDAALQELIAKRDAIQAKIDSQKPLQLPEVSVTGSAGVSNPTGKEGQKLDDRLKALQAEHKALDAALAAFDVTGTETVDEVDRRLNAQVALAKKLTEVLKDVPPNSPLAQQLTQEATAISQATLKLDERKRLLTEGEQVTAQFGDGTAVAAREIDHLNKLLAAGAIDQGTYERAVKKTKETQDDQARTARGAASGFDALIAGVEQGAADLARANSAFEIGKRGINDLASAITDLATGAETDFGKVALSFGRMLLQMELQAQASNFFNSLTGKGPTNQGLFGGILNWLTGSSGADNSFVVGGSAGNGGLATSANGNVFDPSGLVKFGLGGVVNGPTVFPFADGVGLMGEAGPEAIMPLRRGPGGRLGVEASGAGGGGVTVNVYNTAQAKVTTRSSKGPGGAARLDLLIEPLEAAMASRMDRGQGPIPKVLAGRYGVQPVGGSR